MPRWHSHIHGQTKLAASSDSFALSHPWANQTSCIWCPGGIISSMAKLNQWSDAPVALSHPWPNQTSRIWWLGDILSSMAKPNQLHLVTRSNSLNHGQTKPAASGDSVALSQPWPNQTSCTCDPKALSHPWPFWLFVCIYSMSFSGCPVCLDVCLWWVFCLGAFMPPPHYWQAHLFCFN
jgi:hypothetical protein